MARRPLSFNGVRRPRGRVTGDVMIPTARPRGRTLTGQQAMALQGLGRVERFDPKLNAWKKTGVKRRST